uniref:polysaccharide biosynthesis protein n=1 Tax=Bacillus thuringiensis TaxID=1428 RepID=UPI0020BEE5AE
IGIRPGEKLHEAMIMEDDARHTLEFDTYYVIQPEFSLWYADKFEGVIPLPDGFAYTSDNNKEWLNVKDLVRMIAEKDV